jgi:3-oxoacyl-[acyl-carrier protein] reductase
VRGMVERVVDERGGIDVLVNNAGLQLGNWNEGIGLDHDGWRRLLDVNVLGALVCAQQCRPAMAGRPGAVVVNQTSVAAGSAAFGAYGVSKLALEGLTRVLARDLAPDGIRVNALAPGVIVTEELEAEGDPEFVRTIVEERQLVHRRGSPADLVETLFYLCSDASAFVTGQTVVVDGGFTVE